MKPRIKRIGGEWVCKFRGTRNGYGVTPESAYTAWNHLNRIDLQLQGAWVGYFGGGQP